jgi:hypothetical protein
LTKNIAKQRATFERRVLRKISGGIKVNESWGKRYNMEFMQLLGDLDRLPLVTISGLHWIGHGNGMHSNRKVLQVFNSNPQGSRRRGRPKNRWWNYVETDINKCIITNWKGR